MTGVETSIEESQHLAEMPLSTQQPRQVHIHRLTQEIKNLFTEYTPVLTELLLVFLINYWYS